MNRLCFHQLGSLISGVSIGVVRIALHQFAMSEANSGGELSGLVDGFPGGEESQEFSSIDCSGM